jgi:hypothetical protein
MLLPYVFQEHSSVGVNVALTSEGYTVAMLELLTSVCYKGGVWSLRGVIFIESNPLNQSLRKLLKRTDRRTLLYNKNIFPYIHVIRKIIQKVIIIPHIKDIYIYISVSYEMFALLKGFHRSYFGTSFTVALL